LGAFEQGIWLFLVIIEKSHTQSHNMGCHEKTPTTYAPGYIKIYENQEMILMYNYIIRNEVQN
jgi:hypothetical protein